MSYKEKVKLEIKKTLSCDLDVEVERPKIKGHGDLSTNIAMILAKQEKKNPLEIAENIKNKIDQKCFSQITVAKPGFINFSLNDNVLAESLTEVIKEKDSFGHKKDKTKGSIIVEYVSANPTGDLHLGHGRQASVGDSLANVLNASGYSVKKEFYINDYGEQIKKLYDSIWTCYRKLKGENISWQEEYPEELILPHVQSALQLKNDYSSLEEIGQIVKDIILKKQKDILKSINVDYDFWFSETSLHIEEKIDAMLLELNKKNLTYESEGAVWFKAKEFGDVRDRVLKRSDGRPTYLLADIAYHVNKFSRANSLINVWGADHHGQEVGLKGALNAIGENGNNLEIVFIQLVSLKKDNAEVRMSKRAGTVFTVEELLEEVGPDAFRYFLVETSPNNRMVFDIDLAKKQDKDNPVFYIQYAHARSCSIFRQVEHISLDNSIFSEAELYMNLFSVSSEKYSATKELILKILDFPDEIQISAATKQPSRIAHYLKELAGSFHQFYTVCRVITDNENLTKARLGLVKATQITIKNGLNLLGISAPEKM